MEDAEPPTAVRSHDNTCLVHVVTGNRNKVRSNADQRPIENNEKKYILTIVFDNFQQINEPIKEL